MQEIKSTEANHHPLSLSSLQRFAPSSKRLCHLAQDHHHPTQPKARRLRVQVCGWVELQPASTHDGHGWVPLRPLGPVNEQRA